MFKEVKQQMIKELHESNALGVDLAQSSQLNSRIVEEILAIYFDMLKNRPTSPLIRSVFTGLAGFCPHVNAEIVYDLMAELKLYLSTEISRKGRSVANLFAGLLCAVEVAQGVASKVFDDVEENDLLKTLYQAVALLYSCQAEI